MRSKETIHEALETLEETYHKDHWELQEELKRTINHEQEHCNHSSTAVEQKRRDVGEKGAVVWVRWEEMYCTSFYHIIAERHEETTKTDWIRN